MGFSSEWDVRGVGSLGCGERVRSFVRAFCSRVRLWNWFLGVVFYLEGRGYLMFCVEFFFFGRDLGS